MPEPDGGFSYMLQAAAGGSAFPRSAAGVSRSITQASLKATTSSAGSNTCNASRPAISRRPANAHYFYGQYYAVQAMFLAGGDYWAELVSGHSR